MANDKHWRNQTVAPQRASGPPLPLLAGAGAGLALALTLAFFFWPASEGRVVFQLEPAHAEVALLLSDGKRILAPSDAAVTAVLDAGSHEAEVTAQGYEPAQVRFEIVGGELETVPVRLEPAFGTIDLAIEPSAASVEVVPATGGSPLPVVLVDGRWRSELEPGEYVATVRADGHHDASVKFEIIAGEPTLLPVSLQPVARTRTRHTRDTVVVPAPVPGPRYYGPRYYGPRYYGPGPRRPPRPPRPRFP